LIHGVGYDLTYWDRQIEALYPDFDVVAFDLPAHGRSTGGPQQCTFGELTAIVASLIRKSGKRPVHLVGISFGGMIAQATVLAYPELIRSLTLMGTAARFSEAGRGAMRARAEAIRTGGMPAVLQSSLERWFTPETIERRPDIIDRVSQTVLGDDPAVQATIWNLIANDFDVYHRLGEIRCPALVLVGDRDPSTPISAATELAQGISGAELQILPDASHMVTLELPDAVNAALRRFLTAN
jgi:3-oxoadipate enol-lactonase